MRNAGVAMVAGVAALALDACGTNPPADHAGNMPAHGFNEQYRNVVEIVSDPPDAICAVKGGSGDLHVPDSAPRLVTLAVVSDSPAIVTCRKAGFQERSRGIVSTQVMGPGYLPLMAIISVPGAISMANSGKGRRFPPMAVVVLRPEDGSHELDSWRAAKRDFITARWDAFFAEQRDLCAQSRIGRDCRIPDQLRSVIDADLSGL